MEPRTSSVNTKLQALETISKAGIPTFVMIAPIIPGLNSMDILPTAEAVADRGAHSFGYTLVRLNDTVEPVFIDWLEEHYPDRKDKVLNQIASLHGGKLGEKNVAKRMAGEGNIADVIHNTFKIARQKYFKDKKMEPLATHLFDGTKGEQLSLF